MSEQSSSLGYASAPAHVSRKRSAAWIALLVSGVLTICGGVCMGGGGTLVMLAMHSGGSDSIVIAVTVGVLLLGIAAGVTEIICGTWLHRGSRRAGVVGAVIVGIKLLVVVGIMVMGIVLFVIGGGTDVGGMVIGVTFYGVAAAALAIVEWLVLRALREMRLVG